MLYMITPQPKLSPLITYIYMHIIFSKCTSIQTDPACVPIIRQLNLSGCIVKNRYVMLSQEKTLKK